MRAFVIVSALFAVSSLGTAALAHEGVDRDAVSHQRVVRDHVAREHVTHERVARETFAREHVAVDRAGRPENKGDRVARPTEERGEHARSLATAKASTSQASAPVPRSVAAVAAPVVNCDPGSEGCATPRSSGVEKAHGASVSKSSSSKKDAPKVDKATSEALKHIVLAKRCMKADSCTGL